MGEEYSVADSLKIKYDGLFIARDLYKEIDNFLTIKGYDKEEKKHVEKVKTAGKDISFELEFTKKKSKYMKYIIEVEISVSGMKNALVTKGDRKMKYNDGEVEVEISSKLKTDLTEKWKSKPMNVFLGHVINKYLYPVYTSSEIKELKSETEHLRTTVKAFLNLYKV